MDAVPAMNTNRPIRLTAEGAVCVFQAPIVMKGLMKLSVVMEGNKAHHVSNCSTVSRYSATGMVPTER